MRRQRQRAPDSAPLFLPVSQFLNPSALPVACTADRRSEAGKLGTKSAAGSWSGRAMETPPPFQESAHCDVCRCTFSAFRRRHHCRSCGRTLCHEHSSYHMALPQYGIYTDVRVCYDCFNESSSQGRAGNAASAGSISGAADSFSGLSLGKEDASSPMKNLTVQSAAPLIECKCGMPLCICEAPKPEPAPAPVKNISSVPSTTQSNPRPKKPANTQQKASATSSSNSSSFLNIGLMSNDSNDKGLSDYEVSGEGLREAIKGGDVKGVKKLLTQGVDCNYCDKQGFTLLHLAALFNQTEIALVLMDHGANVESKNGQGETPLDCAPAMLQYKMRQRMEELAASSRPLE
ncbi:vacuolar protein sorting-associated protein 27-like isoform X2 [Miscanthus floridulus]|uniref:vacuolar protein sorting-associated protein 27-like isoform X2 n=1 Tax=Miscanthus floridulus TaxID=154761 RepID=UPI0034575729